jgi:hypothetical protein
MEFDLLAFVESAWPIAGFGAAFTIAAGTLIGQLGAAGRLQLILTVGVGFVIGFCGMLAVQGGLPGNFAYWFGDVVIGFLTAFVGVGVYNADVHASKKGSELAQ